MKRFLLALLFLFSASLFAQPTIDFETVGNNWVWNPFDLGTGGMFDIVANPSPGGLNTSDSCAMLAIDRYMVILGQVFIVLIFQI